MDRLYGARINDSTESVVLRILHVKVCYSSQHPSSNQRVSLLHAVLVVVVGALLLDVAA